MLRKSTFFDFFIRHETMDFDRFMAESTEDEHYINWNGYVLPMHYGDAEAEYSAIRQSCAIFDGTPFRKVRIQGPGAGRFLDHLVTRPVSVLATMRATYVVFCNEDGSLKDDSVLFKFDDDDYLIMPSDIDHIPYFEGVRQRLGIDGVSFTDCTYTMIGLAVQGPLSAAVLIEMGFDGAEMMKPFAVREYKLSDNTVHVSRTGFTADLGYECWFAPDLADTIAERVKSARERLDIAIPGYGLNATQACRLEGGFIVAGWDCATEVDPQPGFERTPYELGLGWLVNLEGAPFVGRDALAQQTQNGVPNTLRSFEIDSTEVPEDGTALQDGIGDGAIQVGIVTCSTWSWGFDAVIGNASIKSEHADRDNAWVNIDGSLYEVKLSHGPLLTLDRRNQVPAPVNRICHYSS
jgi:aminomethyltransferase